MRRALSLLLPMLLFGAAGCEGDSTGPTPPAYEDIDGTYAGVMAGTSQGISANLLFGFTIGQTDGDITGSWSFTGKLNDGNTSMDVTGTGSLEGTVTSGHDPSLNFKIKTSTCPDYEATFSGDYDSDTHRLTVRGPVEFFNYQTCDVGLTYQATIVLDG
ncbi:MAG TPA: hypothetical protein VFK04_18000 [Gemmatimonadaceae bacterium]|nr:hypothetical protein [Gemmatimonadaceae bacterium]